MTYIIVDTANTFFRARHVVQGAAEIKLGMAFHITFNSIKKAWHDFGGTHVCSASRVDHGAKTFTSLTKPTDKKLVQQ